MEKPITTIEDLAVLIQNTMASKEDIQEVKTDIKAINTRLDHLEARVGRIEADIHELRDEVIRRHEFEDVLDRIKYIEKQLGIRHFQYLLRCIVPRPVL
jgi:septal ring factor EnvC (AmiA/AmiB activator)